MALRRAGIAGALTPESGSDSEALLSMPELADVRGQRIGLLTAPGGRGVLLRELQARGAEVIVAEVYQRQLRAPGTARLRALAQLPPRSALLFTSLQAFEPLWQALDADSRQNLLRRPCVVASARLQSMAEGLGFIDVVRADGAEPKRLLDALGEHVAKRRFR